MLDPKLQPPPQETLGENFWFGALQWFFWVLYQKHREQMQK